MRRAASRYFSLVICSVALAACEPKPLPKRYLDLRVCPTHLILDSERTSIDDFSLFGSLSKSDVVLLSFGNQVSTDLLQVVTTRVKQTGANVAYKDEFQASCGELVARDFWYPEQPSPLPDTKTIAVFTTKDAVDDYISILKDIGATFHAYEIAGGAAVVDTYGLTEAQEREVCFRSKKCARLKNGASIPESAGEL